jgi:hypothetical protein
MSFILSEETWGQYKTPELGFVLFVNFPWFFIPLCLLIKMIFNENPFSILEKKKNKKK